MVQLALETIVVPWPGRRCCQLTPSTTSGIRILGGGRDEHLLRTALGDVEFGLGAVGEESRWTRAPRPRRGCPTEALAGSRSLRILMG